MHLTVAGSGESVNCRPGLQAVIAPVGLPWEGEGHLRRHLFDTRLVI